MTPGELRETLAATLRALAEHDQELRDLDAALGDGDLGITVRSGSLAAADVLEAAAGHDAATFLQAVGRAFATANPSTFAALIGGGVMAASSSLAGRQELTPDDAFVFGSAAVAKIRARGKAELGDKTVLDAVVPTLDVLGESAGESAAELCRSMAKIAHQRVEDTAGWESRKGRAGWLGERSIGHRDAGATAYALFLDEFSARLEAR